MSAKPIDHARVAWKVVLRPVALTILVVLGLAQACLWFAVATETIPGCWAEAPPIVRGEGAYDNYSERMAWLHDHPGVCYQTWAQAWPAGDALRWWGVTSIAGTIGALAALLLVAVVRGIVKAYLDRLRVEVAERQDKERGVFFYPKEAKR